VEVLVADDAVGILEVVLDLECRVELAGGQAGDRQTMRDVVPVVPAVAAAEASAEVPSGVVVAEDLTFKRVLDRVCMRDGIVAATAHPHAEDHGEDDRRSRSHTNRQHWPET